MNIAKLAEALTKTLNDYGVKAVALKRSEIDQAGNYLAFEEQELNRLPHPNTARFSLYIARSDLEGKEGAYNEIDKLWALSEARGVKTSGFKRIEGGALHIYRAVITVIAPKTKE